MKSAATGIALLILLSGFGGAVQAQEGAVDTVAGPARAIDADIIMVDEQRVILWGIDAPERSQYCLVNDQKWGCYDAALRVLQNLVGRGAVSCVLTGEPDPFNRRHGVCEAAGEDIGAAMVRAGMALAMTEQSDDYLSVQDEAIAASVGLWQVGVQFEEPWVWRRTRTPGGFR